MQGRGHDRVGTVGIAMDKRRAARRETCRQGFGNETRRRRRLGQCLQEGWRRHEGQGTWPAPGGNGHAVDADRTGTIRDEGAGQPANSLQGQGGGRLKETRIRHDGASFLTRDADARPLKRDPQAWTPLLSPLGVPDREAEPVFPLQTFRLKRAGFRAYGQAGPGRPWQPGPGVPGQRRTG